MPANDSLVDELEWVNMTRGEVDGQMNHTSRVKSKLEENPFIPIGLVGTTAFLILGLRAMKRGEAMKSQMMMRGRVVAQGATVFALILGFTIQGASSRRKRVTAD